MKIDFPDNESFRVPFDGEPVDLQRWPTLEENPCYKNRKDYKRRLKKLRSAIHDLQEVMFAHDRHAVLVIFQAMDAAGKDSTISAVFRGVNPHGVVVTPFKRPSELELDHNFLWRTTRAMPERGRIGVFNRSYYEEVLVVRVHPGIVRNTQRLPEERTTDLERLWQERYEAIRNFERYASRNGTTIVKFFLHLSREEQARRFLRRLDTPSKNWKFSEGDLEERRHWNDYQSAYAACLAETSTPEAPWYAIPADDKYGMRLRVASILLEHLSRLDMAYPTIDRDRQRELDACRKRLEKGD